MRHAFFGLAELGSIDEKPGGVGILASRPRNTEAARTEPVI
jgi:hypothetical protein